MEPVKTFLGGETPKMQEFTGQCEKHGPSTCLVHHRDPVQAWHCHDCRQDEEADKKRRAAEKIKHAAYLAQANIPERYVGQKFPKEHITPEQVEMRRIVRAFWDTIAARRQWAVLVMVGETGTGKTLTACELAQALIDRAHMTVRYCTSKQMVSEIQAAYGTPGMSEESELARLAKYDLLIIDEIDAIPDQPNAKLLLTELINRRYNANRPVVAISNQPFDNLVKFVGDRVDSRLHENSFVCNFSWKDFRKQP